MPAFRGAPREYREGSGRGRGRIICTLCYEEDDKVRRAEDTIVTESERGGEEWLHLCSKHKDSFRGKILRHYTDIKPRPR